MVESSALSLSTVQLRSQRGHGVVTSGLEPGPSARPESGSREARGGESGRETDVEVAP